MVHLNVTYNHRWLLDDILVSGDYILCIKCIKGNTLQKRFLMGTRVYIDWCIPGFIFLCH